MYDDSIRWTCFSDYIRRQGTLSNCERSYRSLTKLNKSFATQYFAQAAL